MSGQDMPDQPKIHRSNSQNTNAQGHERERIAVITGGWSGEREISLLSCESMLKALTVLDKYEFQAVEFNRDLLAFVQQIRAFQPDIALLAIHGAGAEDGILQSFLEMERIPYTSPSVTTSAVCMDKAFTNAIVERVGIKTPAWQLIDVEVLKKNSCADGLFSFSFPFFIKPCGEGSSLGVSIIHKQTELDEALNRWTFGPNVFVQEYIKGQELQVAVINGKALGAIEIRPKHEFFDYEAKYTDGLTQHIFPPTIPDAVYRELLQQSEKLCSALRCNSIVRPEFVYGSVSGSVSNSGNDSEKDLYFLEVNTQPGMTSLSIIPDIARHFDVSYPDLVEQLIAGARIYS